ncbi:MAG: TerD family protein [Alphaproteobacteria bacterium]
MSDDIFDTRFEDKEVELDDGFVEVGEEINILEKDPSVHRLLFGMGWELKAFDGDTVDLDMSLFLVDKNYQTRMDEDFIFYNNMMALDGAIKHHGDSRTGAGEGDDECISVDLHGVPFDVMRIEIFLSIYQGLEKDQSLGMVRNTYFRLMNEENSHELLRFDMSKIMKEKEDTGVIVGYLDREGPKWHFKPTAEFVHGGLKEYAKTKGLIIIDQ